MATLNELNDITKKNIHLLCTYKCSRNCKFCCNKQYDILKDVPMVSYKELSEAENIFLTGGEPFEFSSPNDIARDLKYVYNNIKNVYAYTNAFELYEYLFYKNGILNHLDGLTISIKSEDDAKAFERYLLDNEHILPLKSNKLYVFPGYEDVKANDHFEKHLRVWQEDFKPSPDSIFRRMF